MSEQNNCCACSSRPKLIFTCSGAADVGAIADQAARQLNREGVGKMFCLAGVGGRVSGIMASTSCAEDILALDGCSLNCARNTLLQAGFEKFKHLQLSDLGFIKGQSPANEEAIQKVAQQGKILLEEGVLS